MHSISNIAIRIYLYNAPLSIGGRSVNIPALKKTGIISNSICENPRLPIILSSIVVTCAGTTEVFMISYLDFLVILQINWRDKLYPFLSALIAVYQLEYF